MSGSGPKRTYEYASPKNISSKEGTYDPNEARKILEGDLEQRVINYAKFNYGKGEEVKAKLHQGDYRSNGVNPLDVLDDVCGKPEVLEAGSSCDSIDDVVKYGKSKPNMLKVAVKGTINLVNKTCWYYPVFGALSGKKLEAKARKRGENPNYYVVSNSIVEGAAVTAGISYVSTNAAIASAIFYALSAFFRIDFGLCHCKKYTSTGEEYYGSPIVSLPYYIPAVSKLIKMFFVVAGTKIKDQLVQSYASAYEEEQQSLRLRKERGEFKILPVRPMPPPPLPYQTAEKAEVLSQIESQARIEDEPVILPEEFDEELEDFDKSLRERTGAL